MTSSETHAHLDRQRNVACREVASDGAESFGGRFLVRSVQAMGNDFELIPTVKMETDIQ